MAHGVPSKTMGRALHLLLVAAFLLAGCAGTPDDAGGGGSGFAPQSGHDEDTDPAAPGLVLEGDLRECEAGVCVDAEARNEGEATYHISDFCVPPWSESMQRDGEGVQHREPMAHCLGFGTEPFGPGDVITHNTSWDGTLWDADSESYHDAPQGAYQWTINFRAWEDGQGGDAHDLAITFTVIVGET